MPPPILSYEPTQLRKRQSRSPLYSYEPDEPKWDEKVIIIQTALASICALSPVLLLGYGFLLAPLGILFAANAWSDREKNPPLRLWILIALWANVGLCALFFVWLAGALALWA